MGVERVTNMSEKKRCMIQLLTMQHIPKQQSDPSQVTPPVYTLGMTFSGGKHPLGQFVSAYLASLSPSIECSSSAAECDTENSVYLGKHHLAINKTLFLS